MSKNITARAIYISNGELKFLELKSLKNIENFVSLTTDIHYGIIRKGNISTTTSN